MLTSRFAKLASMVAAAVMVFSLVAVGEAEARMGGSLGSRGFRTVQSAPATTTSPSVTSPIHRATTPNTGTSSPYGHGAQNTFGQPPPGVWAGLGGGVDGGPHG